ncbi:hypothetical protein AB0K71_22375 [Streptomyces syringium]|uniref:hypothetical protein n=1 Tax=Streptomyces syringium TaxID=76729 RepID=UPI0033BB7B26
MWSWRGGGSPRRCPRLSPDGRGNVLSTDWLKSTKPKRSCLTLKWAPEVEISGSYPKKSCTSYRAKEKDYLMTFEDFAYRKAPAGAKAPNWTQPPASAGTPAAGSGHGH